jgi:hypothetical protein
MTEKRKKPAELARVPNQLLGDVRRMIERARATVASAVNAGLTMLYWQIGRRIGQEILRGTRAEYGTEIVSALARQLATEYGRGFSEKSLRHMIRFAEAFAEESGRTCPAGNCQETLDGSSAGIAFPEAEATETSQTRGRARAAVAEGRPGGRSPGLIP